MKQLYLLLLLVAFSLTSATAEAYKGYIITKNRRQLTGSIGAITYVGNFTEVVFINDFGNSYNLRPELIRGFVFERDEEVFAFESLPTDQGWMFLQVVAQGDNLSLYRSPEEKTAIYIARSGVQAETFKATEYWIRGKDRPAVRLKRVRYRKRLRKLFQAKAPELAAKIGQKGYRFKDMVQIIEEYNAILGRKKYKL
ncbi:MAG: hypothetical protein AAF798_16755 [Bacteroidota bacterium]